MNVRSKHDDNIYFAWIASRLSAGSAAFKKLYNAFGNAEEIYKCLNYQNLNLTEKQQLSLIDKNLSSAQRSIDSALYSGFTPISYESEYYPEKLKNLSNPPPIFYTKGKIVNFDKYYCVGMVGTRNASRAALKQASEISCNLGKKGILIISGLALGIDTEVHLSCMENGGITVGISGVKAGQIYPKENKNTYEMMYKKGSVICEHSPTDNVEKSAFPIRNRIISALSDALIMVEAPEKSGALITAEKSLSLKKKVYVPQSTLQNNVGGINLLERGAEILASEDEILNLFASQNNREFFPVEEKENEKQATIDFLEENKVLYIDENNPKSQFENESSNEENYKSVLSKELIDGLSPNESIVYNYILNMKSVSTDQMIKDLNLTGTEAASCASMLEIYGYIRRMPGDKWSII